MAQVSTQAGRPVAGKISTSRPPDYVPGLLQVKIKEDVVQGMPDVRHAGRSTLRLMRLPTSVDQPFAELRKKNAIKEVMPVFSRRTGGRPLAGAPRSVAAAFTESVRDSENEDLRGINLIQLSSNADVEKVEKELRKTEGVEYVHRVPARWLCARRRSATADPLRNRQWALRAINFFNVNPSTDARPVKVGVLDTGIDTTHPDLQNFNTYVHDGAGAKDIVGHGTHVAGIVAAGINNNVGITGVVQCELNVWKIFGDKPYRGEYFVEELMYQRALNDARNSGMQVINLSIGGTVYSQTEAMLLKKLYNAGCVIVAAMGNEYEEGNPTEYPAAYPNVIAVGAINESNRRAWFSNTGRHIALVAPGENILSTLPMKTSSYRDETEYGAWDGTSMAAPHVAAAAALVIRKKPNSTPAKVAQRLKQTAAKLPAMKKKAKTDAYGSGLLDLAAAAR